jgi:DNA-binding transcriptional MerR regulator
MSDDLLTIKEIARQLDLPESNIRYYRDKFEEFLPYVGEGRRRRYKPEALNVFRFIVSELRENKSTEEISRELSARFSRTMQLASPEEKKKHFYPALEQELESHEFTQILSQQAQALESLSQTLKEQNKREDNLHLLYQDQETMKRALILLWKINKKHLGEKDNTTAEKKLKNLETKVNKLQMELEELRKEHRELQNKYNQEILNLKKDFEANS